MGVVLPLYDRCYLGTQSALGTYGEPRAGYTFDTNTAVRCAVIAPKPAEDAAGLQRAQGMVRIAFRLDSGVTAATRVQVYRRLRQTISPAEYYTVQGAPRRVRNRLIAECVQTDARSAK